MDEVLGRKMVLMKGRVRIPNKARYSTASLLVCFNVSFYSSFFLQTTTYSSSCFTLSFFFDYDRLLVLEIFCFPFNCELHL